MKRTAQAKSLRRNLFNLSAVLAIFIFITACVCRSDKDSDRDLSNDSKPTQNVKVETNQQTNPTRRPDTKGKNTDAGDFLVEHIPVQNPRYNEIDKQVKQEKLLEQAADKLNRSLILPYDITLRTKDCNEVNAFYNPKDHSVTVCYEIMEHFYALFRSVGKSDQAAYDKMFDAIRFVFLHELGHALIDAYQLPIMGNEEDAADRCSSYICLTELGDEGTRAAMAAADGFHIESRDSSPSSRSMADEHLLQDQRFYNTLCMIYGSDTQKYSYVVGDQYLPKERAVRCPAEFSRTVQSWSNLFEPWRK